ncbi:uncharacterized protein LOC111324260 [Stylophora pistillata]|uniref:uncharacterized protein LOC111324260 n=1 Tax=Stylophora pistillata TaxID=50429 RepID=UPI000C04C5BA|nr:uncharacterized protein LOC111324260 [Stylophora pistillata]
MDFRQHLLDSLNEIIEHIQEGGNRGGDLENTVLRLEVLYEAALVNGDIPLEAVDLINQARTHLNVNLNQQEPFQGYEAPAVSEVGRRGRPNFAISEQQLLFFRVIFVREQLHV